MKKTLYILILSIITIFCIIFGTLYHMGVGLHNLFEKTQEETVTTESGEKELEAFSEISVDADVATVVIQQGDRYEIRWDVKKANVPKYEVKNEVLTVKQNQKKPSVSGNTFCKIYITVPQDVVLSELEVDADVGEVKISDIATMHTNISSDVGDVDIENCQLGETELGADVGNIVLRKCGFMDLECDSDVGNFEIHSEEDLSHYSYNLKAAVGDVKVNGDNMKKSFQKQGDNGYDVHVRCDVGNIELNY